MVECALKPASIAKVETIHHKETDRVEAITRAEQRTKKIREVK